MGKYQQVVLSFQNKEYLHYPKRNDRNDCENKVRGERRLCKTGQEVMTRTYRLRGLKNV